MGKVFFTYFFTLSLCLKRLVINRAGIKRLYQKIRVSIEITGLLSMLDTTHKVNDCCRPQQ